MNRPPANAWDHLYRDGGRPWKGLPEEGLEARGTVLELGVGNGKNLTALRPAERIIGLDRSRQALLSCRRWHTLPLVLGDAVSLPFRDRCFDLVCASHLLGHLLEEERRRAAREMVRVLAGDGRIYVSVFGERDMRCGKGEEVEERTFLRGNGIICHYFLEGEVESLFEGLRTERSWVREMGKRFHMREELRQERRALFRP
jgi:SAM-dependent methyltransferase